MSERKQMSLGIDGRVRNADAEAKLDEIMAMGFRTAAAKLALKYLRTITIEAVAGPEITDAHLRHLEGMRYLVGIIEGRIASHNKRKG